MKECAYKWETDLHDVWVGPTLVWLVVLGVFEQHFVHICAGVLEQLVGAVEDDQGNLTVTQHAQLVGFLHQAKLSLCKRHLERSREKAGLDGSPAALMAQHKAEKLRWMTVCVFAQRVQALKYS